MGTVRRESGGDLGVFILSHSAGRCFSGSPRGRGGVGTVSCTWVTGHHIASGPHLERTSPQRSGNARQVLSFLPLLMAQPEHRWGQAEHILGKEKSKHFCCFCRPMAGGVCAGPAGAAGWASSPVPGAEALVCCFILDFYFVKFAPTLCFVSP